MRIAEDHTGIRTFGAAAALSGLALLLSGCGMSLPDFSEPSAPPPVAAAPAAPAALTEAPTKLKREQLIGKWGTAAYHDEKDRKRVTVQAKAMCKQPYVITKGPTDGVMMQVVDDPKPYELRLKGASDGKTYLGMEAPPGDINDREVISLTRTEMVLRFVDPDADTRYGTFVYVRCT